MGQAYPVLMIDMPTKARSCKYWQTDCAHEQYFKEMTGDYEARARMIDVLCSQFVFSSSLFPWLALTEKLRRVFAAKHTPRADRKCLAGCLSLLIVVECTYW